MDLFSKVLDKIKNGMEITLTPSNVARGDRFILFNDFRKSVKVKFLTSGSGLIWVWFDGGSPMLLENCPDSFLETILRNIE